MNRTTLNFICNLNSVALVFKTIKHQNTVYILMAPWINFALPKKCNYKKDAFKNINMYT